MNKGMFGLFSFDFINNKLEVKTESMVQNSKLLAMTWDNENNDVMGPIYVTVMSGTVMYVKFRLIIDYNKPTTADVKL